MSAERSANRARAVEVTFFVASMCLLGWSVVLRLDPAATPRAANAQLLLSVGLALTTGAPLVARPRVRLVAILTAAGVLALSIYQLVRG